MATRFKGKQSVSQRGKSFQPLLRLLRTLLDGTPVTLKEACELMEYEEPATARHLRDIVEHLSCVERTTSGGQTVWRVRREQGSAPSPLRLGALLVSQALLASLRGSVLDDEVNELIGEVLAQLGHDEYSSIDISRMFYAHARTTRIRNVDADTLDRVVRAILGRHVIAATYRSFEGEAETIELRPYTLITWEEGLYCFGYCETSSNVDHSQRRKLCNLVRLSEVKTTGRRFAYPPADAHEPRRMMQFCMGMFLPPEDDRPPESVVLEFAPRWKSYLKEHWYHETQQSLSEGGASDWLRVTYQLHVNFDLVRWVRGFGNEVRVIEPRQLRDWVAAGSSTPP